MLRMRDFGCCVLPAILLGGVLLSGCSDNKRYLDSALGRAYERYSLVMQDAAAEGAEEIPELSVFQFCDGAFYQKQQVKPDASGAVSISATSGSTLYFVSGVSLPLSGESVNEEEFRRIAVGRNLHDNSAPEFLTAVVALGGGEAVDTRAGSDGRTLVELKRSVARIDLGKPTDERIRIREIVIEDAPAAIYPFLEGMPVSEETVSYRKVFETGVGDKQEALFRIFESPRPVHLQVLGSYGDVPLRLNMELPTVECNKVYELEVRNAGSTVEGTIQIKPWDEGGTVVGSPDAGNRILIDADRSRIPAGVKVDYANNLVEVPAGGVEG
ncbi:MAG: hypothetical protein K2K83_00480, partial [Rikenella sp.]|nr:hypothetical protein [Rikenella sp.]